ncbi:MULTISPECIES: PDR/VanB family oxidoreductase [Ramlibacter]|uniref:2Fe-2S iron-sulfur cluster binding domain-containing protein n=1 Tax=Ramlibacter pinisoli TaxID=2682844 RepID=A0A6N8INY8_9BURK|nr:MULTISPECIES: PDR/VanB family oxidoreductase [Ramlibacter]MBA2960615.1 oxidoreductase [Ramlibacter sp. CGMCC 1.13660]MVQ27946.1 2Fe-2S iron-sulfur cluster binding domain-containing protein [Ramlibacter pinisoli]
MSDLRLRVTAVRTEARDVLRLELQDPHGALLPAFAPGAHLTLHLPNGLQRQYSLAGDNRERHRYVLGVGRAAASRGGSDYVHRMLRAGAEVTCSAPANNFELVPDAPRYLFIAGGIGITPILSMVRWCEAAGEPWTLVYAARSRVRMGFYEELRAYGRRVRFHCDDEQGAPLAVAPLLADVEPGTQVYCCGPAPLMAAVREHGAHLGDEALHFEWFSAPAADAPPAAAAADGFWVDLRRSGTSLHVPPDRSVLDVLEANGHDVPFACREGLCGTCETAVCEGEPEHRDYVYPPSQRDTLRTMLVCVSRAKSARLVLDL